MTGKISCKFPTTPPPLLQKIAIWHYSPKSTIRIVSETVQLQSTLVGCHQQFHIPWWRHQMETFSTLLAICAGNSLVTGDFPTQRPVTRSFDVFSDLRLNKRLSKQWWGWWFETPSRPLWPHCNVMNVKISYKFPITPSPHPPKKWWFAMISKPSHYYLHEVTLIPAWIS